MMQLFNGFLIKHTLPKFSRECFLAKVFITATFGNYNKWMYLVDPTSYLMHISRKHNNWFKSSNGNQNLSVGFELKCFFISSFHGCHLEEQFRWQIWMNFYGFKKFVRVFNQKEFLTATIQLMIAMNTLPFVEVLLDLKQINKNLFVCLNLAFFLRFPLINYLIRL